MGPRGRRGGATREKVQYALAVALAALLVVGSLVLVFGPSLVPR